MENEIDNLYPDENKEFPEESKESAEQTESQYSVADFHYKPVEIPHRVDWFVVLLVWIILGVLGYVLFTTSVFE